MAANEPTRTPDSQRALPRRGLLVVIGILLFHGLAYYDHAFTTLWAPALGFGLVLISWLGFWITPFLVLDLFIVCVQQISRADIPTPPLFSVWFPSILLWGGKIAAGWWLFARVAKGSRWLDDPRSAVLFLLLVPGLAVAVGDLLFASLAVLLQSDPEISFWATFGTEWIGNILGILVLAPFLMIVVTPLLQSWNLIDDDQQNPFRFRDSSFGDVLELTGLVLGNALLALIQVTLHLGRENAGWPLWGFSLLLVVWSSLRQGLRGGLSTAFAGSVVALTLGGFKGATPALFSPLQGNLLAQCSTALLVGASVRWILMTEARYRQLVGHIPLVLASVRLKSGVSLPPNGVSSRPLGPQSKPAPKTTPNIANAAEVVLVSKAATTLLGIDPQNLVGPYQLWLDLVHPDDRDVMIASIAQMGLQRQPVICEYRLRPKADAGKPQGTAPRDRWMRETLAPQYSDEGLLEGWESVLEDISEHRILQQENRRVTGMLQALVANMPTGIYFVHGPGGQPILVNARARQLLGQREDQAAGLAHISQVFRLHRADGTEYPVEDLPITKALRFGQTCTANDIIVHRPDGRRTPLFTWAAPVDLGSIGRPEAAVWILEDLSALQQAEFARRETEARLRAVFETMAEGVVVQNKGGVIIESNPAAAAILGLSLEQLVGRCWLGPDVGCLREDSLPCPADQQPDRLASQIKLPVRNVIFGVPRASGEIRWMLVNSMPLPVGTAFSPNPKGAQLVTTFSDVTLERDAQRIVMAAKEKYQTLLDSLPVMLLQLDPDGTPVYLNPAAQQLTGYAAGDLGQAGFWESTIDPADRPRLYLALQDAAHDKETRFEFGFLTKSQEQKVGLALVFPQKQDGRNIGSTWVVVDMTRQRRLEEELVHSRRLELVGRLASGSIHDFNNLMSGVIDTAMIAKAEVREQPQLVNHLDHIEQTATQASQLFSQILTLGKTTTQTLHSVDLNKALQSALPLLKNVLPGTIQIKMVLADEPLFIEADDSQLKQVILNLALTARDAMPQGGVLRLHTQADLRDGKPWASLAVEIGFKESATHDESL